LASPAVLSPEFGSLVEIIWSIGAVAKKKRNAGCEQMKRVMPSLI
jgi:hypothetical protein